MPKLVRYMSYSYELKPWLKRLFGVLGFGLLCVLFVALSTLTVLLFMRANGTVF